MKIRNLRCARLACAVITSLQRQFFKQTLPLSLILLASPAVAQTAPIPTPTPVQQILASIGPNPTPPPINGVYPNFPSPAYAIVTYPSADPTTQSASVVSPCVDGIFALVGLAPGQVVQVTIQYPPNQALDLVNLEALDGGIILPPSTTNTNLAIVTVTYPWGVVQQLAPSVPLPATPQVSQLVIAADGTLSFTFVATNDPGKNQVSLRDGSQELGLQFWVFDPINLQNNPPAITASNPYPSAAD